MSGLRFESWHYCGCHLSDSTDYMIGPLGRSKGLVYLYVCYSHTARQLIDYMAIEATAVWS